MLQKGQDFWIVRRSVSASLLGIKLPFGALHIEHQTEDHVAHTVCPHDQV